LAIWLARGEADFEAKFAAFLTTKREVSEDVGQTVREIIADVRARGDAALAEYTLRFDQPDFAETPIPVTAEGIEDGFSGGRAGRPGRRTGRSS